MATFLRTSLVAQGLRLHASTSGSAGSIPGQGSKSLHAMGHSKPTQTLQSSLSWLISKISFIRSSDYKTNCLEVII